LILWGRHVAWECPRCTGWQVHNSYSLDLQSNVAIVEYIKKVYFSCVRCNYRVKVKTTDSIGLNVKCSFFNDAREACLFVQKKNLSKSGTASLTDTFLNANIR
jgi:hypothetical protein